MNAGEQKTKKLRTGIDKFAVVDYNAEHIQTEDEDEYIGKVPSRESQAVGLRQGTPDGMDF